MAYDVKLDAQCTDCCETSRCSAGFLDYPAVCCGYAHYEGLDHPVCCPSTHLCKVVQNVFQCVSSTSGRTETALNPVYGYPATFTDKGVGGSSTPYDSGGDPSSTIGIVIAAVLFLLFVGCLMKKIIRCCKAMWRGCFRVFCPCFQRTRSPRNRSASSATSSSQGTSSGGDGNRVGRRQGWCPNFLTGWLPSSSPTAQRRGGQRQRRSQQTAGPGRDMNEYPETIEQRERRQQQAARGIEANAIHRPPMHDGSDIENQWRPQSGIDNTSIFETQRQKTIDAKPQDAYEYKSDNYFYDLPPTEAPPPLGPTNLESLPSPPSYKMQKSSEKWGYDRASAPPNVDRS